MIVTFHDIFQFSIYIFKTTFHPKLLQSRDFSVKSRILLSFSQQKTMEIATFPRCPTVPHGAPRCPTVPPRCPTVPHGAARPATSPTTLKRRPRPPRPRRRKPRRPRRRRWRRCRPRREVQRGENISALQWNIYSIYI